VPEAAGESPLPPEWRSTTSSKGVRYYYNVKTKETSWQRPTATPTDDDEGYGRAPNLDSPRAPAKTPSKPYDEAPSLLFAAPTQTDDGESSTGNFDVFVFLFIHDTF
jgi:hypothetical protein